jgi:hypothetical protein
MAKGLHRTIQVACSAIIGLMASGCGKHCEEVPGDVTAAERTWITYAAVQTVPFVNAEGDTATMTAGNIASRWHNGGGSKDDCSKDYESLHQPVTGLGIYNEEIYVAHDRVTGNAPGYVCGYYMDMQPVHGVIVNGTSYDNVYVSWDSLVQFSRTAGLLKVREWEKLP